MALARLAAAASFALLVAGCKPGLPGSGENSIGALHYEQVEFTRQGGAKCPAEPVATDRENALCAFFKVSYPNIVSAASPDVVAGLNQFIQEQLLDYSDADGKKPKSLDEMAGMFIADYAKDPEPFSAWELERKVDVRFGAERVITLVSSEYGYTGGAHPFSGERYFVLDPATGRQLMLSDLLNPGFEGELNVAAEKAFRQARHISPDSSLESEGFWFDNDVFVVNNNFGVLQDGLVFYFNSYEVAPYALGPSEFVVPYEDIRSLLPSGGVLDKLASR